jgi:hypothetical protein
MSHYAEIKVQFRQEHEAELVDALRGIFGSRVSVHPEGKGLIGWTGGDRSEKSVKSKDYAPPCHVIIKKKGVSNDIGYRRTMDGAYTAYISDYDKAHVFNEEKQNRVLQHYTVAVAQKTLSKGGYASFTKTVLEDGSIRLTGSAFR